MCKLNDNAVYKHTSLKYISTLAVLCLTSFVFAGEGNRSPEKPGPYDIGYRQVLLTNNAATAKASPADANGRVLEISVWYPIDKKVAARGIPILYDESLSSLLNYGAPPPHLSHRALLNVRVDPSSTLPLTLTDLNIPACDDPLGTACVASSIVGLPISKHGRFPVLAFSHGSGIASKWYSVLPEHLASYGYIVVTPRHSGNSSPDTLIYIGTGGLACGALPFRPCSDSGDIPALNRPQDVSFALDKVFDGSLGADLKKAADINKVGAFGHSFGGYTTLMLAGGLQTNTGSFSAGALSDSRIRAAVVISGVDENFSADSSSPVTLLPKPNIEAIHIPTVIMVGEHERNIAGHDFNAEAQDFFNRLNTKKTKVQYRIVVNDAVHQSFTNICEQGYLDGIKLGNDNPSGADSFLLTALFLLDNRLPPYPTNLVGKTDFGYQAECRNSFLYKASNRAIWDALTIPPPAPPGITLGSLLLNNPPFSIPLANLPGFIDPITSQFVPTKTSDKVQKTTNGYLVAFFNTYLKKQSQYKRFLVAKHGEAEVEVCRQEGHKKKCEIKVRCD